MAPSRLLTVLSLDPGRVSQNSKLGEILKITCDHAGVTPKDGDVFVLDARLAAIAESGQQTAMNAEGFAHATAEHSVRTVAARGYGNPPSTMRLVETTHGTVELNAGISVDDGQVILPLKNPTETAGKLHSELRDYYGVRLGLVLLTSLPHPFRHGQRPAALAAFGMDTQRTADLVTAASALIGADNFQFAVLRGLDAGNNDGVVDTGKGMGAFAQWFTWGWAEAVHTAIGADPEQLDALSGDGSDDILTRVMRAIAAVRNASAPLPGENAWRIRPAGAGSSIRIEPAGNTYTSKTGGHPVMEATLGLGSLVDRLSTALWVEGLTAHPSFAWGQRGTSEGANIDIELIDQ